MPRYRRVNIDGQSLYKTEMGYGKRTQSAGRSREAPARSA